MRFLALWLHVLGAAVWWGSLLWQALACRPGAELRPLVGEARRARPVTWSALGVVVVTGAYQLTSFGPLEAALASGAAALLAVKFMLVILAVTLAAQRDFAELPHLADLLARGDDPASALRALTWRGWMVVILGAVVVGLGLAVSRR